MATATTEPVRLPPGPRIPKIVQLSVILTAAQHRWVPALGRRYGSTFTINLPFFGKTVMISDPTLVKDIYSTSGGLIERPTNNSARYSAQDRRSASPAKNTSSAANWCSRRLTGSG